jgi:tRNA A37 methylthiotransferase MiaB
MFAFSMREKTHAHRSLKDDVAEEVKQERLRRVI